MLLKPPTWRLFALVSLITLPVAASRAAEPLTGEQIFSQKCARCHGATGEGTEEEYPEALVGEKSVLELAKLIEKTMPKDKVGECVGEDAKRVAAFIHETFYSPTAQARNKPARIELSRLTVRQYRNAVTDLIGGFRQRGKWDGATHGLAGEYFKTRRFNRGERAFERVDPTVTFDFGEGSPAEGIQPPEFSARWQGSVMAPETGEYEFIIKSENGARLWVNDNARPLIDAGVKSGTDSEFRQSIWLLGGRVYPIKLEFFKFKEKKASIGLWWKQPGRVDAVIPARFLVTERWPESFVIATPFPPDDRSVGYERGTSISKAWDSATTDGALETSAYVVRKLNELAGVGENASGRRERIRDFCRIFVERAFRRPLTQDERLLYVDRHFDGDIAPEIALKRVVLLALKSPRFLYQDLSDQQTGDYAVAERLAMYLWDSLPDEELLQAAAAGELKTIEQVTKQAERMTADLRAKTKLAEFFVRWLKLDGMGELSKDTEKFPGFDAALVSDLRTSLELFVEDVVWSEGSDLRELLRSDEMFLNGRLAKFYGVEMAADAPFTKVKFEPEERAGVLSHPYLLSGFAYTATSSPIHRGVFISRSVLGRTLRPPPEAFTPLAPDLHPDLSTRERVALQTKGMMCQSCHNLINPLGFTLERFDAVGRYRKEEKGKPIDAQGSYVTKSGDAVKFTGAREIAGFLADSEETHAAFVQQMFHYLVKQPVRAFGPERAAELRQSLVKNGFHMRRLMVNIAEMAAMRQPNQ